MESEIENKLTQKLRKGVWNAIKDYNMIQDGDKIMVCLSGGKDSYTMLDILLHVQKASVFNFDIVAVNLDQKQPGFPEHVLPEYLTKLGVDFKIVEKDTYSIVVEKLGVGKTMCSLCSRLRRGTLYTAAEELGCNKIALGHHKDDIVETLLLNMFFAGKLEAMPPKYRTDDNRFEVIRPLSYCKESDIIDFSILKQYPIIPCNLCGSQDGLQRNNMKAMLADWEEKFPGRKDIIFSAARNIYPSHLLDRELFDFQNLPLKLPKEGKSKVNEFVP